MVHRYMTLTKAVLVSMIDDLERRLESAQPAAQVPAPAAPLALAAPPAYPDLSDRVAELNTENVGLKGELAGLKGKLQQEQDLVVRLRAEITTLNEAALRNSASTPALEERVRTLERENVFNKAMSDTKDESLKRVEEENERLVRENAKLVGDNMTLRNSSSMIEATHSQMKTAYEEIQRRSTDTARANLEKIARLEAQTRQDAVDIEDKNREIERLREEMSQNRKSSRNVANEELARITERNKILQSNLEQALKLKDEHAASVASLGTEVHTQRTEIKRLKERNSILAAKGMECYTASVENNQRYCNEIKVVNDLKAAITDVLQDKNLDGFMPKVKSALEKHNKEDVQANQNDAEYIRAKEFFTGNTV